MTLIQLEYIVAVDNYRSFVVAAEKCFITQPTLSMQIQKLEEQLGVKIFDRSRQPVVPTEIGVKIIGQARQILLESQKIKEIIQTAKGELSGILKIGVIPTIAPYLLPRVISAFMKKYPKMQLQIWEYTTDKIIQQLKNGIIDVGILSTPLHDSSIHEIPVFYEKFVAYVSETSPLFQKKQLDPEDISQEKLWLLNEGHCMRGQVLNICHYKHNESNEARFEYNTGSVETLKKMVDVNGGVTILPQLAIMDYTEDELSKIRYFKEPDPVREISVVTSNNMVKKQAIAALCKEISLAVPASFLSKNKKNILTF